MTPLHLTADRAGERADQFLARMLPELTRSAAQRLLEEGAVTLGGLPVKKNYKTSPGDQLVLALPDPAPIDVLPQDIPLPGDVFRELILSGVIPVTVLDQCFRQENQTILENAAFWNPPSTQKY